MKILVIGSGGREHALVWKISQSKNIEKIYCAPGNAGIADMAECVDIKSDDIHALLDFAKKQSIELTVVGPEAPLVEGIVDLFEEAGLKIFGPNKNAARLEASKGFAKEIMRKYSVATAEFAICSDMAGVNEAVGRLGLPIVIKADGLAAGKGVVICDTKESARKAAASMLVDKIFGESGNKVVVEECLQGEEASILVLTNGKTAIPLASSQDHKRVFDGDLGPNTGGMGAYSPAPVVTQEILGFVMDKVIDPVIKGMAKEGARYKGVLYAGIMITAKGPKVLEFNIRFGDPETQAVLARLKTDLVEAMLWTLSDKAAAPQLQWDKRSSVCVVVSSEGYPGSYEKGRLITGLDKAAQDKDIVIFHAGIKKLTVADPSLQVSADKTKVSDRYLTDGGRVLGITGLGDTLNEAIAKAYAALEKIRFAGMHYRRDIGWRALRTQ